MKIYNANYHLIKGFRVPIKRIDMLLKNTCRSEVNFIMDTLCNLLKNFDIQN